MSKPTTAEMRKWLATVPLFGRHGRTAKHYLSITLDKLETAEAIAKINEDDELLQQGVNNERTRKD